MRFLKIGVLTVLVAALVAACGTVQDTAQMLDMEGVTALEGHKGWWTADWNGRNGLDSENCGLVGEGERTAAGWIHWVFNTKGSSTDAKLVLAGTGSGEYAPGAPLNANVWHFYTPFFELEGLEATVQLKGEPGRPGRLVISDWCAGEDEGKTLKVTKTAETSFKRVHKWDLDKSVDPERVYLYPDGYADVTWMLDVTYLGAEDSHFVVFGEITIENISSLGEPVTIESITDDLGLAGFDDIDLDCDGSGPYTIAFGDTLTCEYSVDVIGYVEAGDAGTNTVTVKVEGETEPYVATAPWEFDEPTDERFATVYVWDYKVWDDKTWTLEGDFKAPNGGRITYSERFYRSDWQADPCDKEKTKENFAKLTTRSSDFDPTKHRYLAEASAIVTVILKCEEDPKVEKLEVTKTADTSFKRRHHWDISKYVDPSMVTLYADGSGDTTVTWTVDVTYEGYDDSHWNVSGEITIRNVGQLDARIESVDDVLAGTPIDVECGVTLPYTLPVGETLTCTYDEDGYVEGKNVVTVTTKRGKTYTGEAAIAWGSPTTEVNATVDVVDVSDVFGSVDLGTVTAPNGDTFTYDKHFAWADYGRDLCGEYHYANVAKLMVGEKKLAEAEASLKVRVQCKEFKGETAWAANADEPLEFRYQDPGNWATYVEYDGEEKTSTLFAGQTMVAGTVDFSAPDDGFVSIAVTMAHGWVFDAVAENLKVQDYDSDPSGNPAPGLFDHKTDCDAAATACTIFVPVNDFYGVHVNVGTWVPVDFD